MNYLEVIQKRSLSVSVTVYDKNLSNFEKKGELSIKRILDDFTFDSGIAFFCKYEEKEFYFETRDIIFKQLYSILEDERASIESKSSVLLGQNINILDKNKVFSSLDIQLYKTKEITIDFILKCKDGNEIVIEVNLSDYTNLLQSISN